MYYSAIKYNDIANGIGVRTILFVSGCRNHCKECFQPETWNFQYGKEFDRFAMDDILSSLAPSHIRGLTLLGGDPFEPENQIALYPFVKEVKEKYPHKDIWAYTGYLLDKDLVPGGKCHTAVTEDLLSMVDVLVDGPFIIAQKDLMLKFKGSANQRVINLPHYLQTGTISEIF